jgi:hypothetical protein
MKHKERGRVRVNARPGHMAGKPSTAATSKNTHAKRGKGKLASKLHGKVAHDFGTNAPEKFGITAKKTENDNLGRKLRPAAHNPRQTKVAGRARNLVKRLSGHVI